LIIFDPKNRVTKIHLFYGIIFANDYNSLSVSIKIAGISG